MIASLIRICWYRLRETLTPCLGAYFRQLQGYSGTLKMFCHFYCLSNRYLVPIGQFLFQALEVVGFCRA